MKILLLHPNDSVDLGPWREIHWDWIVDIGWSGLTTYADLAQRLNCRVFSLNDVPNHAQHRDQLRQLFHIFNGRLLDTEGVDWWDIFSSQLYDRIQQALLVSALARQVPSGAEIAATRPHFMAHALSTLLSREIKPFAADTGSGFANRLARYAGAATTFRPAQILQITLDKWDTDYRFRRHWSPSPPASSEPAILLPSSYVNVSRVQVAYARMLPHQNFLLTTTRRSGGHVDRPSNVALRSLASYAPRPFSPSTDKECDSILEQWREIQSKLFTTDDILLPAQQLGVFSGFSSFLQKGLHIRDAWRNLFSREPIRAVLSGDENNPYTRLPVVLARARNIPTVFADHGALNMTFAFRPLISQTYLVQGDMARDYIVNWCGVAANRVLAAAPVSSTQPKLVSNTKRDWIVFFSEAYELNAGNTKSFYKQILPHLCTLASQTQRKVIVKLHPFESFSGRTQFVNNSVPPAHKHLVELREGPMTPDLFERAWFSLTLESSVAIESTLQGVPCFLCHWFDASWYEYVTQFAKFSAGQILKTPQEILEIPKRMETFQITSEIRQRLVNPISPEQLEQFLSSTVPK